MNINTAIPYAWLGRSWTSTPTPTRVQEQPENSRKKIKDEGETVATGRIPAGRRDRLRGLLLQVEAVVYDDGPPCNR